MSHLIDKDELIDEILKQDTKVVDWDSVPTTVRRDVDVLSEIRHAPTKQTNWIPMDSEPPEKEDLYLVAWRPTDRKCVYEHYYELLQWDGKQWENATDRTGKPMKVIAWRKLPGFYKEDE